MKKVVSKPIFFSVVFLLVIACTKELKYLSQPPQPLCDAIPDGLYSLIRPNVNADVHHGYEKISQCGQVFYQDKWQSREIVLSQTAEDHARDIKRTRGTGYLDFQLPDEAFINADHGYVTFPAKNRCSQEIARKSSTSIFLSSMITVNSFRPIIFDEFVEYYSRLGIEYENMLLTIQVNAYTKEEELRFLVRKLESRNIYYDIFWGNWTSESLMFHQAHKLFFCTEGTDWIVVADSDEFHEYPGGNLGEFVKRLELHGYNFATGIFLDRVTVSGSLTGMNDQLPLFKQFPLGCRLHRVLKLGTPKKIMIFRGDLRINRGHHRLALCWFWKRRNQLHLTPWSRCPPLEREKILPYPDKLNVHHFKWMKGQYEATKQKAKVWEGTDVGDMYKNVMKYLDHCRGICVNFPGLQCSRQKSLY